MTSQDVGYRRLKAHLIASTGLAFYADRDKLLMDLIAGRLSELGLRNCSSYTAFLANGERGGAEMEVLIAQLTIGETYFFRDEDQFAAIRDVILPDILERKQASKQLRIWSAGCATGAEPYSLAILLARELSERIAGWEVHILATDLNRSFLARAAEGKFRKAALRSISDDVKRECFSSDGSTWRIHPQYKHWISFHQMNLMENEFSHSFPRGAEFDLILCRNVMIYFAREVSCRLIGQLHQALGEGGWLVVGASESNLDNLKIFRTVNAAGTRLFQKTKISPASVRDTGPPPALLQVVAPPPGVSHPLPPDLDGLRHLADSGDWHRAAEYGKRLLTHNGLNPEAYFYQALIFEKLGIADEPEQSLRHAIYLDRNFALAHYHLGLVLKRGGRTSAAERSFGNVLKVLAGVPDLAMVTAGPELTVTGLKGLARMHLEGSKEK